MNVQKNNVDFEFHTMPVIEKTDLINENVMDFKLLDGFSAETSGGLLIMMPEDNAQDFQKELKEENGQITW